jgi:hypothetical protein
MTKKELKNLQLKSIFAAIKENYNVTSDFEDMEGHGYFTFQITVDGVQYAFDLSRNDFSVIGYKLKGNIDYIEQRILETEIEHLIEQTLNNIFKYK